VQYQFNQETGNGTAERAEMQGEVGTLTAATYSTCPPNQRSWEFAASRITVNNATATGVARNATLRVGGVPVLWLPVVSFPTDNKRRSGLLAPTLGRDDQNGLDLKLPVYLNLAPNYDATITPRWLSKRGLMLGGEFRFLGEGTRGKFTGTWLPDDDLTGSDRSLVGFENTTTLSRHWYFSTHLNNVSDRDYFGDFGDSIEATSISLLGSDIGFYGRGRYWSASLTAESWQIASPLVQDGDEPYRRLPRLQATAARPLLRWLEAGLELEAVRFDHDALDSFNPANLLRYDGGNRVDFRPWLRAHLGGGAWFVTPQVAWRYTAYNSLAGTPLLFGAETSADRNVPIVSVDAGAHFERYFDWRGGDYIQTLEPRLFYLWVPYRDQLALPVFDTRELTFGWTSLFRDNRFGGADRQADANQLAVALTTRVLRAGDGSERLSASIGRISYFEDPQVRLQATDPLPPSDGSAWIANLGLAVGERWKLGFTQQWDPNDRRTDLSSITTQVRWDNGAVVNAAYRYRRPSDGLTALEQTDLSFALPVKRNWSLYGRWNYSLHDNQTIEALGGFEWKSCCAAVRLLGRQYIRSFDSRENFGLYLEIELNGLGSFGRDTARLLDDAILGYAR
jgi:LPS-assembly protein